jgi:hypothetical protein
MRTIKKYELREGENKITVPNLSELICATDEGGKVYVWMEVETTEKETNERAFLVMSVEEEIKQQMSLGFTGWGRIGEKVVMIYEIL